MTKKKNFSPFKNEEDCIQLADLTIENRLDRISIFGSIDLWLDKGGLKLAKELKSVLDATIDEMEKRELPDRIELASVEIVKNPF